METKYTKHQVARSAKPDSLTEAYSASDARHQQWVDIWGSEEQYAQAHGAFGTELKPEFGLDRTFMSVTTDQATAARFANGGTVYGGYVPKSLLVPHSSRSGRK